MGCGELTVSTPNARPQNYADARPTMYNDTLGETVPVTFSAGQEIAFECMPGYTTNGAKDGATTFPVKCTNLGYYNVTAACVEASKCGALPNISNAGPTGVKVAPGKVQFSCQQGYSLDGEEVVAGGFRKNQLFELKCIEFSGEYEKFEGKCTLYGHVPASKTVHLYNQVFEALFVVSCKGTIRQAFHNATAPPSGLDTACGKIESPDGKSSCDALVSKIKSDFASKQSARDSAIEAQNAEKKLEWFEEPKGLPNIKDEAQEFCLNLWKVLEAPRPANG